MAQPSQFPTDAKVRGFNELGEPVECWAVDARERAATNPPTFFRTWPPATSPAAVSAPSPDAPPAQAEAMAVTATPIEPKKR